MTFGPKVLFCSANYLTTTTVRQSVCCLRLQIGPQQALNFIVLFALEPSEWVCGALAHSVRALNPS